MTVFIRLFLLLFLFSSSAFGQSASLLPNAVQQFFDNDGNPLSAGTVTTYFPNTSTFKTTWRNSTETLANTNPIVLDAAGRAIIYGQGTYRQLVKDALGNIIWDAVTAPGGGGTDPTLVGDGQLVGTIKPWAGLTAPNQYMFSYGQELLRSTYSSLFTAITQQLAVICTASSTSFTGISDTTQLNIGSPVELSCVPPGTTIVSKTTTAIVLSNASNISTNATATFFPFGNGNGTTTFNLPDLRDYVIAGRGNMGGVAANRLDTNFGANSSNALGGKGGSQNSTIVVDNLPPYAPSGNLNLSTFDPEHSHGFPFASANVSTGGGTVAWTTTPGVPTSDTSNAATGISVSGSFTGDDQGGTSVPLGVVQPTITMNYIIKVTPDVSIAIASGVASIGGMTGVISCGTGLLCTGNDISVTGGGGSGNTAQVFQSGTNTYLYNQLSNLSIPGLINFACNGVADDTPAWNAFMAKVADGTIPPFSTLWFGDRATGSSYCRFASRPNQWGDTLRIDGSPWFIRAYQPGTLAAVVGTANNGAGRIRLTVTSVTGIATGQTVGVYGVKGTTEANSLWTATVVDGTHIDLMANTATGVNSAFANAFSSLAVTNATNNGSGLVRISVASGASTLVYNPVVIQSVGGVTGANGTFAISVINDTTFDLVGSTFSGAYTSGGTIYSGIVLTAPLEPFMEMGPQSGTDFQCTESSGNNLLIYSGAGTYGGIGYDVGSFNIGGTGLGGCISTRMTNLQITESTGSNWAVSARIDGSQSPGGPNPGDFAGIREPIIDNLFTRSAIYAGLWVRSTGAPKLTNLQIVAINYASLLGDLYIDALPGSPGTTNPTYSAYISGNATGYVVTGQNVNSSQITFGSIYTANIVNASNVGILVTAGSCTVAPTVVGGTNNRVDCNANTYNSGFMTIGSGLNVQSGQINLVGTALTRYATGNLDIYTGSTQTRFVSADGNTVLGTLNNTTGVLAWNFSITCPTCATAAGTALTRTNDTNVTVTLGGSPTTALLNAASLTLGWTGTLSTTRGGLGGDFSASSGVLTIAAGTVSASATVSSALGGTGQDFSASTGVAIYTAGMAAIQATTGTGNVVRSASPTISGTISGTNILAITGLAQIGANTFLSNWTSGTANVVANTIPDCPDSGGNHLNYTANAMTCGNSGGGGATGLASPTATVGLTVVNGSAVTAMRSDGAPPLSSAVQTALTGTNHGVAIGTGAFGFGATAVMSNGQLLVGQSAADPLPKSITGDISFAASGASTITKTGIGNVFKPGQVFIATQLSGLGLGLTDFACDNNTDDTPAWNTFMGKVYNAENNTGGVIPQYSTLWFPGSAGAGPVGSSGFCIFNSRPVQVGQALHIDGNNIIFFRNYQPGQKIQITSMAAGTGGSTRLGLASATTIMTGDAIGVFGVGGLGSTHNANGLWTANRIDSTNIELVGVPFTTNGAGANSYIMSAPMESFIDLGPRNSSGFFCGDTKLSNVEILTQANYWGGIPVAVSSAVTNVGAQTGACINPVIEHLVVQNNTNAYWGATLVLDGSSSVGNPPGAFAGVRDPRVRSVEGHIGMFYGVLLRAVASANISELNIVAPIFTSVYGGVVMDGLVSTNPTYSSIISGGQVQDWVKFGPNSNTTLLNFGVVGGFQFTSTATAAITAIASTCNSAATVQGTDNYVMCNGAGLGSGFGLTVSGDYIVKTPAAGGKNVFFDVGNGFVSTNGNLTVGHTANHGFTAWLQSPNTFTLALNSTASTGPATYWYNNGSIGIAIEFHPEIGGGFYISNQWMGGGGGVVLTPGATSWASSSDRNLKKDWQPVSILDKIAAHPEIDFAGTFKWKNSEKEDFGYIAQDVYKVFPAMSVPGQSDPDAKIDDLRDIDARTWNADREKAGIYALQGVKELLKEITDLKRRVDALQQRQIPNTKRQPKQKVKQ